MMMRRITVKAVFAFAVVIGLSLAAYRYFVSNAKKISKVEETNQLHNTSAPHSPETKEIDAEKSTKKFCLREKDCCQFLHRPTESEILYRNRYWQAHVDGKEEIIVYSAFYDDRPIVGSIPWIRVLGVRRKSERPLYCYVWYSEMETPLVAEAEILKTGRDFYINGGLTYSQRLFSCQLPSGSDEIPTHVSIATQRCTRSTICLPVVYSRPSHKWSHNFGICMKVTYGYFPPDRIVEWMEVYSMFGVTSVTVYNGTMDGRMDRVFDYYAKRGFVDIRQMAPATADRSSEGVRLACPASLNDCMMRNMYTHRFIVVVDYDDLIVPRHHENYDDLIRYVDRSLNHSQSYHTYSFRNTYFFTYFPEDKSQPAYLRTLRYRFRARPCRYLYIAKSFVDPRQCKSVFNHFCMIRFDRSAISVDVDPSLALSHHYRSECNLKKSLCHEFDEEKTVDDVMLKFKGPLVERVSKVLAEIGFHRKN